MKRLLALLLLLLHLWAPPVHRYCWTDPHGVRHCSTAHHHVVKR